MAGHELHVIAERPEFVGYRADQVFVVAAREVCAADRALEQYVADEGDLCICVVDHDVARRVTRRVDDAELHAFQFQLVAIFEIAVGGDVLQTGQAVLHGRAFDLVEPELVVLVRADDGHAETFAKLVGSAGVIEVAVGEPHLLQRQAEMLERADECVDVAAGINQHGVLGLCVPDQGAVLLQRRHRDDADLQVGFGACVGHAPRMAVSTPRSKVV